MVIRNYVSYWILPVFSSLVWSGMLLTMLLYWVIHDHRTHYPSMSPHTTIAYISNIGAHRLKPLFITGSTLMTISLDISIAERWLRHNGRLVPNTSRSEKVLAILTIVFAILGTAGIILLSVFRRRQSQEAALYIPASVYCRLYFLCHLYLLGVSTSRKKCVPLFSPLLEI